MAERELRNTSGGPEFRCDCGWTGYVIEITEWDVQPERDRAVRVCPGCEDAVPEWGAIRGLNDVAMITKGSLRDALVEVGETDTE